MNQRTPIRKPALHKGVAFALLAAALFGASTPFAKSLVGHVAPVALAGMLYFGSGLGLLACFLGRALTNHESLDKPVLLVAADLPWLGGAIAAGRFRAGRKKLTRACAVASVNSSLSASTG